MNPSTSSERQRRGPPGPPTRIALRFMSVCPPACRQLRSVRSEMLSRAATSLIERSSKVFALAILPSITGSGGCKTILQHLRPIVQTLLFSSPFLLFVYYDLGCRKLGTKPNTPQKGQQHERLQ